MEQHEQAELSFVQRTLPWLIAGGALVVYLVTLNHWVTLASLPVVAKVTGWDWTSIQAAPLLFLVTYPFRFLPAAWQPSQVMPGHVRGRFTQFVP